MLDIKNLSVAVSEKFVIRNISLSISKSEVLILFGPNGSGKTTLLKSIMGFNGYHIKNGYIIFKEKSLNNLNIEDRIKLGLGIMYQHPPKIRGVKLIQIAKFLCKDENRIYELAEKLSLKEHLNRDVNLNFSGGEMKRSELFQMLLQDPALLLLDEPESGVDVENISIMGKVLNDYLKRKNKSALIITHTGYILDYVKAERGCVMIDGKIWCVGNPKEIFDSIRKSGYGKCKQCQRRKEI